MPRDLATMSLSELNGAISELQELINSIENAGLISYDAFDVLGNCLSFRYKFFGGQLEDIDEAVRVGQKALSPETPDQTKRATRLQNLATSLGYRFERTGQKTDLDDSIRYGQDSLSATAPDDENRSQRLQNMAASLWQRFRTYGDSDDLGIAISLEEHVLENSNNSDKPVLLNNLGTWLGAKFEWEGDIEDLDRAIVTLRDAENITHPSHRTRDGVLSNLSTLLVYRFDRTAQLKDLDDAIVYQQQALVIKPTRSQWLSNLSNCFGRRFRRLGKPEDLEQAVTLSDTAMEITPVFDPDRPGVLNNLSMWLAERFKATKSDDDLQKAIIYGREAIKRTPESHPDQGKRLNNLGGWHYFRYECHGELKDLSEAINLRRKAIKVTWEGHPDLTTMHFNLADDLRERYAKLRAPDDIRDAKSTFIKALSLPNGPPLTRIRAAIAAGELLTTDCESEKASNVYQTAVALLSKVSPRSLSEDDQKYNLSGLSGLSSLAAAAALEAGKTAEEALEILEEGRGILAGLAITSRNDITSLAEKDIDLHSKYTKLREIVSAPILGSNIATEGILRTLAALGPAGDVGTYVSRAIDWRRQAVNRLNELEREIRGISGLERFQLSLSPNELKSLAREGPIVAFNVTRVRSDAFLVSSGDIRSIQLKQFSFDDLKEKVGNIIGEGRLSVGTPSTKASRTRRLKKILQWLWDMAVQPVLQELNLLSPVTSEQLPRIYWITNGLMGLAPLHAAGKYGELSKDNTYSHVISTYIPTFKALKYAREKIPRSLNQSSQQILIVTMPETPGSASGADLHLHKEVSAIQEVFGQVSLPVKVLTMPSKNDILEEIKAYTIVHFACHGRSDARDRSDGGLLVGGSEQNEADLLAIRDLATVTNPEAQIAYLSACSTAENSALHLMDEAIHIASAFQLIGFSNVIGTLWEADDMAAIQVAGMFYKIALKNLKKSPEDRPPGGIARALHEAVTALRNSDENGGGSRKLIEDPIIWVPFIHIGA